MIILVVAMHITITDLNLLHEYIKLNGHVLQPI